MYVCIHIYIYMHIYIYIYVCPAAVKRHHASHIAAYCAVVVTPQQHKHMQRHSWAKGHNRTMTGDEGSG